MLEAATSSKKASRGAIAEVEENMPKTVSIGKIIAILRLHIKKCSPDAAHTIIHTARTSIISLYGIKLRPKIMPTTRKAAADTIGLAMQSPPYQIMISLSS